MRKNQQCKELGGRAFQAMRTGGSKALMGKSLGYSRNTKETGCVGVKGVGRLVLGYVGIG